jgi:hypothetical protein
MQGRASSPNRGDLGHPQGGVGLVPPRPTSGNTGPPWGCAPSRRTGAVPVVTRCGAVALGSSLSHVVRQDPDSTHTSRCDEKALGSNLADGCRARVTVTVAHYAIKY